MQLGAGIKIGSGITVQLPASITISSHPGDQTADSGNTATFSVTATITLGATLSYQWQKQEGGAGEWSNVSGATSSSYTTSSLTVVDDNTDKYRVVVSGTRLASSVTSNSATLTVNSGVTPNSMIVAQNEPGGYYYGASNGAGGGTPFGTITSDYFNAVYSTDFNDGGAISNYVYMIDGTYSGFTVTYGIIESDLITYPRVFTIDNNNYTFILDTASGYNRYLYYGSLGFASSIGNTISVSFDPALTPSVTSNTIIVGSWSGYGMSLFGASNGQSPSGMSTQVNFGTIVSDYINQIIYNGTVTNIVLKNGGPYMGPGTVTDGWLSGDTTGSFRIFTINNTDYEFTAAGTGSNKYYTYTGNAGLFIGTVGTEIPVIYANSQSSGPNTTNGTITVGTSAGEYGWKANTFGSGNFIPGMMKQLYYDGTDTQVWFKTGTYTGSIVVDDSAATVGGEANVTVTVSGTQQIGALTTTNSFGPKATFSGDVFSLSSNNGQTLTVAIDAGGGGGGGGGGGSTTYTATTDYSTGGSGPPGISFMSIGGPYTSIGVIVDPTGWTNSAGANALLALTSSSTFTVSAIPDGGGTAITSTITLTSGWASLYGSAQRADITASPPVATSYPDYVPLSVTVGGGGGGGGTTVNFTLFGIWTDTGGVSFRVYATETADVALMDAIPSGATLTITDNTGPSTTITLSGGFMKSGPSGPPGGERYYYDATATTNNPNFPAEYAQIISLSY